MKIKNLVYSLLVVALFASCNEYNKVLKSTDANLKYEYAKMYYDQAKYSRSATLLEDVVPYFRGTEDAEDALFKLAMSYYKMNDYVSAGEYFSRYCNSYPRGHYTKEARFNLAYGDYKDSPDARLDQDVTLRAIKELDNFIEVYPGDVLADSATMMRLELTDKLCYKEYLSAKLYLDLGSYMGNNYESAVITAHNAQNDYPYSKYREDLSFVIFKARYEAARISVEDRKEERLREAFDEYYTFTNDYPEGKYTKDVAKMFERINKELEKYQ